MSEKKNVKKKSKSQIWKFYNMDGSSFIRLKKECPRCGRGFFLADHKDRFTCGKCGYTLFKKKDKE